MGLISQLFLGKFNLTPPGVARRTRPLGRMACALMLVGNAIACSGSSTSTGGGGGAGSPDAGGSPESGSSDASSTVDAPTGSATSLTGTLGALGPVKPTVSSLVISNSGETLVYLSSAAITCDLLKTSRWLGSAPANSQVVEVIVKGAPKVGVAVSVPPGEVNYAAGGKSSSYEVNADSGSITFTKSETNGVVEGTFNATYSGGGSVSGTFHADFCANGQGY